jgi:hypothetical protein
VQPFHGWTAHQGQEVVDRQVASDAIANAGEFQSARYRIATKDVIQPIATAIAEMPSMNHNDRRLQLKAVGAMIKSCG